MGIEKNSKAILRNICLEHRVEVFHETLLVFIRLKVKGDEREERKQLHNI